MQVTPLYGWRNQGPENLDNGPPFNVLLANVDISRTWPASNDKPLPSGTASHIWLISPGQQALAYFVLFLFQCVSAYIVVEAQQNWMAYPSPSTSLSTPLLSWVPVAPLSWKALLVTSKDANLPGQGSQSNSPIFFSLLLPQRINLNFLLTPIKFFAVGKTWILNPLYCHLVTHCFLYWLISSWSKGGFLLPTRRCT